MPGTSPISRSPTLIRWTGHWRGLPSCTWACSSTPWLPRGTTSARLPVALAVATGWLTTASAFIGGYRILLPLAGFLLLVVIATARSHDRSSAWRTAACAVLGGGLVLEALVRLLFGVAAEPTLVWLHAVLVASAAVLLAVGLTWHARLAMSDLGGIGVERIEPILARYLGVDRVLVNVPDGYGGWLDVAGRPTTPVGHPVLNSSGDVTAMLDAPDLEGVIDADARRLLELVTANARLRHSIGQQLDELTTSRRRLFRSQDVARQAFEERLRNGPLARLDQLVAHVPAGSRGSVARVRDQLAELGRGLDPLTPDGSLVRALRDLSQRSPVPLTLDRPHRARGRRRGTGDLVHVLRGCGQRSQARLGESGHPRDARGGRRDRRRGGRPRSRWSRPGQLRVARRRRPRRGRGGTSRGDFWPWRYDPHRPAAAQICGHPRPGLDGDRDVQTVPGCLRS